jgi:hypothetical protein
VAQPALLPMLPSRCLVRRVERKLLAVLRKQTNSCVHGYLGAYRGKAASTCKHMCVWTMIARPGANASLYIAHHTSHQSPCTLWQEGPALQPPLIMYCEHSERMAGLCMKDAAEGEPHSVRSVAEPRPAHTTPIQMHH